MYGKNQIVVYGNVGVCMVTNISELDFMDDRKLYYTLKPLYEENRIVYAPVEGNRQKMRPVISKDEAEDFIDRLPSIKASQYANEKERREAYHETLLSGSLEKWAAMIGFIYQKEKERAAKGQKISTHYMDEMKGMEKLLFGELAAALQMPLNQIRPYVAQRLSGSSVI